MAETIKRPRLESVDLLRGAVMVIMALDHVRDYLGYPGMNPVNLDVTTLPLFFTRWITHICAPVFFLLTGTGAYLSLDRKSKRELSWFLFTRGCWLIFVELVPLRCLGFQFNFDFHVTMVFILCALGCSMIALSGLVFLPDWMVITIGAGMILTHNLLDNIQSTIRIFILLHQPGFLLNTPQHQVFLVYPIIPWIGVTAAGYGLGSIYRWPSERRRAFLLRLGVLLTIAFPTLRWINRYGDPSRWSVQKSAASTVLSFLNTTKYPPSLLFLLMTLGPALIFLGIVDRGTPHLMRPVLVFGRVPMFYYVLHIPLIHLIAIALCFARYGHIYWMFQSPTLAQFPVRFPPGWGFSLPAIYLVWALVVIALYPLCLWYSRLKQRRSDAWLSYL
jgi:uncharacterized membrane protein